MKKLVVLISLLTAFSKYSFSQIDSIALEETAKMLVASEKGIKSYDDWKIDFSNHVKLKYLPSNGFSKSIFLLMEYRIDNLESLPDSLFKKNEVTYCCDYVVAYSAGIFFRLKGFVNNDITPFIAELARISDEGFILKRDVFSAKKTTSFTSLASQKNIFVKDLDLNCLYLIYRSQIAAFNKNNRMPCLSSCTIKDRRRPYQNSK